MLLLRMVRGHIGLLMLLLMWVIKFVLGKRLRDLGVGSSPKKMKLALALRCRTWRVWPFGFNEVDMVSGEEPVKGKRGRTFGAKNKKEKFMKRLPWCRFVSLIRFLLLQRLTYPNAKGKGKAINWLVW